MTALAGCRAAVPPVQPLPAFPGAEGAGAHSAGGRGGVVLVVDTLADYARGEPAIPGSLRAAVETPGPRIVVFAVAGTIELKRPLRIRHGQLTLAGQSAPAGGICLKGDRVILDADDLVIRFLRFRPGPGAGAEIDAMTNAAARRVIIDHCSFSWSVDEVLSLYSRDDDVISDLTVQWCIVSESLTQSVHSKGSHGYGGIWGGSPATWHHNLIAHHDSRTPRFGRRQQGVDFRNNVVYNWGQNSAYGGEASTVDLVANYYKAGPATQANRRNRILNPTSEPASGLGPGSFFVDQNFIDGFPAISADNWAGGVQPGKGLALDAVRRRQPLSIAPVATDDPATACKRVLDRAGASLPRRDRTDARVVADTRAGTAASGRNGLIDHPDQTGGWPDLADPASPPPPDRDRDGIPDHHEPALGLDPANPSDSCRIAPSGYAFIEIYLNSLVIW